MTPRHHAALPLPYGPMDANGAALLSRMSADIPAVDKNLIKGVCPKKGILNQLVQNIFHSLVTNLRNNGITYYSPAHESYLVALVIRGCTAIELAIPTPVGDESGRVTLSCAGVEGSVFIPGDAAQENQQREVGSETEKRRQTPGCEETVKQVSEHVNHNLRCMCIACGEKY